MGRAILVLVVCTGILYAMASSRMSNIGLSSEDNANANFSQNIARTIAKTGIDFAITQLDSNKYWRNGFTNVTMSGGVLNLTAQTLDSSNVRVHSSGTYNGKTVNITATIYIPEILGVPPPFKPAVFSDLDLTINGTGNVGVYDVTQHYNANIHSNHEIHLNGNINVDGYATSSGGFECNPSQKLAQFLTPIAPTGDPLYKAVPVIPFPPLNVDAMKTLPGVTVLSEGDYTLTGSKNMGNSTTPAIYWVGGNLTLTGNVSGYGIFIVKGSVTLNGNSDLNYPPPSNVNNLAIYANGSVTLNGNCNVTAQVLSNESITLNGGVNLIGSAISKESITINGSGNVKYLPANANLTNPFWPLGEKRPDLTSYWE